jgi:Na+/H+ antiporter NhaD/arsenite permease-like protein
MAELLHSSQLLLKQIWGFKKFAAVIAFWVVCGSCSSHVPNVPFSEIMSSLACTKPFKMMNGLVHVSNDIRYSRKELWEHRKD